MSFLHLRLVTPEISNPSGTTTCIMFKYHMLGVHIGRLMVYQGTCPDNKVKVLLDVSGAQGDGWRYAKIEMRLPNKARVSKIPNLHVRFWHIRI